MNIKPQSGYNQVGGMYYFARMLDKIRLHAKGELHPDFHENLGSGGDGWCCNYLRIDYNALTLRVLDGGNDEEILEWCYENGRFLNEGDILIWNEYIAKKGWRDPSNAHLEELKKASGLGERSDVMTFFDYFEVDEGRAGELKSRE